MLGLIGNFVNSECIFLCKSFLDLFEKYVHFNGIEKDNFGESCLFENFIHALTKIEKLLRMLSLFPLLPSNCKKFLFRGICS